MSQVKSNINSSILSDKVKLKRSIEKYLSALSKLNFSQVDEKTELIVKICNVFYTLYVENNIVTQSDESNDILIRLSPHLDSMLSIDILSEIALFYTDNVNLRFAYDDLCNMIRDKCATFS